MTTTRSSVRKRGKAQRLAASSAHPWRRSPLSARHSRYLGSVCSSLPIAAGLAGAGAGALTGGLIGALVGHGIPEEQARHYEQGVREGGILMGVQPRSDEDAHYFENNWRENR